MKNILIFFALAIISCKNEKANPNVYIDNTVEKSEQLKYEPEPLYNILSRKLETITDVYKANKSSITVNAASASSMVDINQELALFEEVRKTLKLNEETTPDSTKKIFEKLKTILIKTQQKEYPLLRKAYVKITADKLWENNVEVSGNGRIIKFSGGIFANNKNIKDVQGAVVETLEKLKFKKSEYRWYKEASEFTYYDVESSSDTDIEY